MYPNVLFTSVCMHSVRLTQWPTTLNYLSLITQRGVLNGGPLEGTQQGTPW